MKSKAAATKPAKTSKPAARPKTAARSVVAARKPVKLAKKAVKKPVFKKAVKKPVIKNKPTAKPMKEAVAKKAAKAKPVLKAAKKSTAMPAPAKAVSKAVSKAVTKTPGKKTIKPVAAKPVLIQQKPDSRSASHVVHHPGPNGSAHNGDLNGKPKKNAAGLSVKELAHYATVLVQKRRDILGDMRSMETEALSGTGGGLSSLPVHMADMGTDNYEQEFTLGLVEKDRVLLREINHALAKISSGNFGICEGTGVAIGRARLEFQPWAKYSIEFARQKEKNGMGVRQF